jgi:RNA polymerase sigma factor (sigma-70 family)
MCKLDERQKALAEKNMALVYFVLKKMGISQSNSDYEDFAGAGNVGLCKAALVFKEGGCAFSTFAFYLIRNEVLRFLIKRGRDKARLTALDSLAEYASEIDADFEKLEADVLIDEFCRCAEKNLGETAAAVVNLAASGKSCLQIAEKLKLSPSAIEKAKKSARLYLETWLMDGMRETWKK